MKGGNMKKVIIELTTEQLDDLLSNRRRKMAPVIGFIQENVVTKKDYLAGYAVFFIEEEVKPCYLL